ncbi:hypothetical protein D9M68_894970 [compost metagenome]
MRRWRWAKSKSAAEKSSACMPVYTSPLNASSACLAFAGVKSGCQLPKRAAFRPASLSDRLISSAICAGVSSRRMPISSCASSRCSGRVWRSVTGGVS